MTSTERRAASDLDGRTTSDATPPPSPQDAGSSPSPPTDDLLELDAPPLSVAARIFFAVVGGLALIAGLAGLVLPILPGIPIIVIALLLLARTSVRVRRAVNAIDRRLPRRARWALRRMRDRRKRR